MSELVDTSELEELRDVIGADGVSELIDLFVLDSTKQMTALEQAIGSGNDLKVVREAAHAYKGAAAGVGAIKVAEIAKQLENDARDGRCDRASELFHSLKTTTEETKVALASFLRAA